jgi:hypothetical protein
MKFEFELLKNKKWKKTHVKGKGVYGASLCRMVTEFEKGTIKEAIKEEIPTCMDCRELMIDLSLTDAKLAWAVKMSAIQYIHYAHKQEKYHKAKIF